MSEISLCNDILIKYYGTDVQSIIIRSRALKVATMRQIIQVVLSRWTRLTLDEIGQLTGERNHATITNSRKIIENAEYVLHKSGTLYPILEQYQIFERIYLTESGKLHRNIRSYREEMNMI